MTNQIFATKALSDTVSVNNLNLSENEKTIKTYFSKAGSISNVRLVLNNKQQFKGLAYVTYKTEKGALTAVNMLGDTILNGNQLKVKFYKERKKSTKSNESDEKIMKKIDTLQRELGELKQILKSKSNNQAKKNEKDDSINFTSLVPINKSWNIELPHRNWLDYENKRYIVECSGVDRNNEGRSYPFYLFNNKNAWVTNPDQSFAFVSVDFPEPVVANVLTMTARSGMDSKQAPTKFEVIGVKNGVFQSLKKFNKVGWTPNLQLTFTFSNRTKFPQYRICFYENDCQEKIFGLANLNLGVKK